MMIDSTICRIGQTATIAAYRLRTSRSVEVIEYQSVIRSAQVPSEVPECRECQSAEAGQNSDHTSIAAMKPSPHRCCLPHFGTLGTLALPMAFWHFRWHSGTSDGTF